MPERLPEEQPEEQAQVPRSADELFAERLIRRLPHPERAGLWLGAETQAALETIAPPEAPSAALRRRLDDLAARAALDLEFEEQTAALRRQPSLGAYLSFLRQRAGLSMREAATRYRLDFQFLADLERDGLRPGQIPARRLAQLVKRLHGSLPMTERLLAGSIRVPRWIAAPAGGRLYRTAGNAAQNASAAAEASRRARGEAAQWIENPDYRDECEDASRLIQEVRKAWRK